MATLESLGFELERRLILLHANTTMPDNSQLGFVGDPNSINIVGATPGETLLYYCPAGTRYLDRSTSPLARWVKVEDAPGGIWVDESGAGITDVNLYSIATASTSLGGHRAVTVFDGVATYADSTTNFIGHIGITTHAAEASESVKVLMLGYITEPSWSFLVGPVWLGENGILTQNQPATGGSIVIGMAKSQTSLLVKTETLIERE